MATRRRSWSRCMAASSATRISSRCPRTTASSGRCATKTSSRCAGACPDFIRQHIADAMDGRTMSAATSWAPRPTSPRSTTSRRSNRPVAWKYAFERQWLFYKLWGRLLYDPATPDSVFAGRIHAPLRREGAQPLLARLCAGLEHPAAPGLAVRLALGLHAVQRRLPGAAGRRDSLHRRRRAHQSADHGSGLRFGGRLREDDARRRLFGADRITPRQARRRCSSATAARALELVQRIDIARQCLADVRSGRCEGLGQLGLHLAEKLRGAVALQNYRAGDERRRSAGGHRAPVEGAGRTGTRSSASRAPSTRT